MNKPNIRWLLFGTIIFIIIGCSDDNTTVLLDGVLFDFSVDKYVVEQGDSIIVDVAIQNLRPDILTISVPVDPLRYKILKNGFVVDYYPDIYFPAFYDINLLPNHVEKFSVMWDLKDVAGQVVSAGKYNLVSYFCIYRFDCQIIDTSDTPKLDTIIEVIERR